MRNAVANDEILNKVGGTSALVINDTGRQIVVDKQSWCGRSKSAAFHKLCFGCLHRSIDHLYNVDLCRCCLHTLHRTNLSSWIARTAGSNRDAQVLPWNDATGWRSISRLFPAERPVCFWIVEPKINVMRWAEYQIFHATV